MALALSDMEICEQAPEEEATPELSADENTEKTLAPTDTEPEEGASVKTYTQSEVEALLAEQELRMQAEIERQSAAVMAQAASAVDEAHEDIAIFE